MKQHSTCRQALALTAVLLVVLPYLALPSPAYACGGKDVPQELLDALATAEGQALTKAIGDLLAFVAETHGSEYAGEVPTFLIVANEFPNTTGLWKTSLTGPAEKLMNFIMKPKSGGGKQEAGFSKAAVTVVTGLAVSATHNLGTGPQQHYEAFSKDLTEVHDWDEDDASLAADAFVDFGSLVYGAAAQLPEPLTQAVATLYKVSFDCYRQLRQRGFRPPRKVESVCIVWVSTIGSVDDDDDGGSKEKGGGSSTSARSSTDDCNLTCDPPWMLNAEQCYCLPPQGDAINVTDTPVHITAPGERCAAYHFLGG